MREFGLYAGDTVEPERWKQGVLPINDYSISLFRNNKPFGSGTLVAVGGIWGILTAHHVSQFLQRGSEDDTIQIVLAGHPHRFDVPLAACSALVVGAHDETHSSDGPDLALVRLLDPSQIGTLRSKKSFYPLDDGALQKVLDLPYQQMPWWIWGAPAEQQIVQAHRETGEPIMHVMHFCGRAMFAGECNRETFDYVSLKIDAGHDVFPANYEGVSGGGAWLIPVTIDPDIGLATLEFEPPILAGVAFYQSDLDHESRLLSAHGPRSVHAVCEAVRQGT